MVTSMKIIDGDNPIKKRKQRLVKHKRKNWKKTDISEIEQKIDDIRQQERTGGLRSEKADEDLFFIDKENLESQTKNNFKSDKEKSLKIKLHNLRCYRNLLPDPNNTIPAHIVNPLREKLIDSKRTLKREGIEVEKAKRKQRQIEKHKALENKKDSTEIQFDHDLWDGSKKLVINEVNEYYLRSTKQIKPNKPKNFDAKPSALPSIEMPHPGTSYNPSFEDHQDLLVNAHVVELDKLKKEEKRIRNLDSKIPKMTVQEIENLWIKEMSGGLLESTDDENDNKDDKENPLVATDGLQLSKNTTKKQKTKVQKKRQKLIEKLKQKEMENLKQRRIQENEILRIKSLKKEIEKKEEEQKTAKEKRDLAKQQKKLYGQQTLSSCKYEDPEIDLKLSDELTGDLRNLKPEGNILRDRYKSLQKRNMIEPRYKAKRFKKYWTKKYEKNSVKEITI